MATMKELREECAKLGITPGRSLAETERRIAEHKATRDAAVLGTGIMQVTTPGNERHVTFAEFAKAAVAENVKELRKECAKLGIAHADYGEIEARALAMDESHYAKLARHGAAHRSGTGLFLAAAAALGSLPPTPPALREQARSFDAPKSKDQVRRDVRRKMRKATRQAQRRARG